MGKKTISNTFTVNTVEDGKDGLSPNVNILLRTVFERGISAIKEKWQCGNWNGLIIDDSSDTKYIDGRQSIRMTCGYDIKQTMYLQQSVLGKMKPNTWYTMSFNYFSTKGFTMYVNNIINGVRTNIFTDNKVIVDGVEVVVFDTGYNDVYFSAKWDGARHYVTFQTNGNVSTEVLYIGFCMGYDSSFVWAQDLVLCMPKLEEGKDSTAYIANEDDLVGNTGERGKIGRFFYFGGTFNPQDSDPTHGFVVNDAQAPYFEHIENGQKRYHVFNYDTNGKYTMAQIWAISSDWNNKPWESMTNDFKYLITEAIFAKLANFGGAIINGDWMISQYGIKMGSTPTGVPNYTFFDPFLPKGSSQLISGRMIASTEDITFDIEVIGERTYSFDITSNLSEASGDTKNLSVSIDNTSESWAVFADVTSIAFTPATSGTYTMRITNNAQSAVTIGVLMYYEDAFTPNYALDLRTGKSYLQNADISGNVSASTIIAENDQMTTSIQAGVLTIRSKTSPSYGTFAVNDDGEIMLQMYDKDGVLRVNLGGSPTVVISGKWVETEMKEFNVQHPIEISDADCVAYAKDCTKYYQLQLGKQIQNGTIIGYYMPDGSPVTSSQAELIDGRTYESRDTNNPISGYYTVRNDGIFFQKQIDKDGLVIPVCIIQEYDNGLLVQTHEHYMSSNVNPRTT